MTILNLQNRSQQDLDIQQALDQQQAAVNPEQHIWVSASAGTGKTKVLTDRILSLLLNGADARKILCLTFTNAAAAEMMQRLLDRLGHWASCSDALLSQDIYRLLGIPATPDLQERARKLFVEILEMPYGFRIQTIHSFCQGLLASFPFEASISLNTNILTDHARLDLLNQAQEAVLKESLQNQDLAAAIKVLAEQFHSETFKQLCETLVQNRLKFMQVLSSGLQTARDQIFETLELERGFSLLNIIQQQWADNTVSQASLKQMGQQLQEGSSTDQKRSDAILDWLKHDKDVESFERYAGHFLTLEGEIRQRLVTQTLVKIYPKLDIKLRQEADLVQNVVHNLRKHKIAEVSQALLQLGHQLLSHYETFKVEHQALDYDDLILKASDLLNHNDLALWVLYKLDGGIDHLLVDEAQDTNTLQWSIINALTAEFFSGEGVKSQYRTLFAVGDGKQSIYGFQGTDPKIFSSMRHHFSRLLPANQNAWQNLDMNLSFRSTAPILEFVDHLFASPSMRAGVCEEQHLQHLCFRTHHAGHVELWPLIKPDDLSEETSSESIHLQTALARRIANQIEMWLRQGKIIPARARVIQEDDILILVRKRTAFVPALIQALKAKGIPVSGLDRLKLLDQLAIQDLMALGEFLLLPEDDFSLACVLKSPLGDLNEDDLFHLATTRESKSLWERLRDHQHESPFKQVYARLSKLLAQVDFCSPFTLYSEILFGHRGMQKMIARFGEEVIDPLEEFITLTHTYQNQATNSLQSFLHWLRQNNIEIKRDLSQKDTGEIRIMTVHGAKGLQAPIVILADTTSKPIWKESFLWSDLDTSTFLWSPSKSHEIPVTTTLKNEMKVLQDQEYRRLLYVAITRAEDQLYICGHHNNQRSLEGSWYHMIEDAMKHKGQKKKLDFGEVYQWSTLTSDASSSLTIITDSLASDDIIHQSQEMPNWMFEEANLETNNSIKIDFDIQDKRLDRDALTMLAQHSNVKNFFIRPYCSNISLTGYMGEKLYSITLDYLMVLDSEVWIVEHIHATTPQLSRKIKNRLNIYKQLIKNLYPTYQIRVWILWLDEFSFEEINFASL
ncbi:MAG: double-strand break repair helicase AddA [Janthinobacterium lividum]